MRYPFSASRRPGEFEPIGLWMWDVGRDLLQADEKVCDYFSVLPEDGRTGVPLASFLAGVHDDDRPMVSQQIRHAVETGRPFHETYRVMSRSRGMRWIQANGVCFRDEVGRPRTYPGSVFDVTEAKTTFPHALVVEKLIQAGEYAQIAHEPVLERLIEAVLLEAGTRLAETLKASHH